MTTPTCPTCGSFDPKVCNGSGKQFRPHPHGKWDCCCKDQWHEHQAQRESWLRGEMAMAKDRRTGRVEPSDACQSCADKDREIAALKLEKDGFSDAWKGALVVQDELRAELERVRGIIRYTRMSSRWVCLPLEIRKAIDAALSEKEEGK